MPELPTIYTISPSTESTVAVEILTSGLFGRKKKHTLAFENFAGEIHFVSGNASACHFWLTVDSKSVVSRDARLNEKQREKIAQFVRKDVLVVERYPEIRYVSQSIQAKALRGFAVTGTLQIREVTREVKGNMAWTPKRNNEFQLDGDAAMHLSDFGLPRPSRVLGLSRTTDEVMIHLLLWAAVSNPS